MTVPVHVLLRERRDRILRVWQQLVAGDAREVSAAGVALREGLAAFLTDLADWLASGEPAGARRLAADARARIVRRVGDGMDLALVLDEVRLLREAILRVVLDADDAEGPGPPDAQDRAARAGDLVRLNAGFDVALSESVVELVSDRERRAAAESARVDEERRRADDALRASEAELRALVEPWAQAHWETDPEGVVARDSPSWRAYTGQSFEEMHGYGWANAVHPEDRAYAERQWREAVAARRQVDADFRLRAPGGGWRWTNVRASPVIDAAGRVTKWVGVNVDVTERREADDALRASEQRLRAVIEQLPLAVAVLAMDGGVVVGNSALRGFGIIRPPSLDPEQRRRWTALDAEGQPLPPEQWPAVRALRGETVSPGIGFVYRPPGGEEVHAIVSAVPLRDPAGRQTGVIVVVEDVTPLVEAEAELRRADQQKTEFLAVLSHELRNPLAPIRNSLLLLERAAPGTEQAARARAVLLRQTGHLTRLVDDLLDVTRISHGKTELRRERLDLRDLVRRTADDVRSVFDHAGVALRIDEGGGPVWVDGDATRLSQVVGNLLGNAVKFTPAGGAVTVRVGTAAGQATLSVQDTGAGMPPGEEHRMFEAFAQGGQGLARTGGGLGLGLALVKGLVELHGGAVRASSEGPGRGSEFVVTLPVGDAPASAARGGRTGAGPGRTVLIVEDNVDAGETLAEVLALSGHRVRVARDARSGLALGRELGPDVVLCDVGLPDMSGYDFARAARHDPALARARLVAITGYAQAGDRERAREAGFDAHLAKPPQIEAIEALLAEPLPPRRS